MSEKDDPNYNTGNPLCDALRFICDASFAVLPRDVAHQIGEFEKNFWGGVRWLADKQVVWIDEGLRRSDRLREQWRERCHKSGDTNAPPTHEQPESI
jgi:hypothetical protein